MITRTARAGLLLALALAGAWPATVAFAQLGGNEPLHSSADKQLWDRKANRIELIGHAMVRQPGETLTADYIVLDLVSRTLNARGNCVYIAADAVIYGDEMYFNMDTRTGSIVGGRVSNDRFTLAGERINKLGEGRFQTHWGEYSTCHDCPQSWTLLAEDVDMEFDGYAYLSNVTTKIKDAPAFWIPYLVVPIKTRRQTGFLFPSFGFGTSDGYRLTLPFFWAINRSLDMTMAGGYQDKRGGRFEWEGRYALTDRSAGTVNYFYQHDKSFSQRPERMALNIEQKQELPWHIEQKLRFTEVSDNRYPSTFSDVRGNGEPYLSSDLIFSKSSPGLSAFISAKRTRNLIMEDAFDSNSKVRFDPRTVQVYPAVEVTTNDRYLFGSPIAAGITLGVSNFTRAAGPFDKDAVGDPNIPQNPKLYVPGEDPLRIATRASVAPSVYVPFRIADRFSLVPSLEYRNYFYSFPFIENGIGPNTTSVKESPTGTRIPNLHRSYLHFQLDFSTQVERIFDLQDEDTPRRKHFVRPILTYSAIPYVSEDKSHPFQRQIEYARSKQAAGYTFDSYDIVPLDNTTGDTVYFTPLGHSMTYGLTTALIDRHGKVDDTGATYSRPIELSAGQSINFREFRKNLGRGSQPFSRAYAELLLGSERFSSATTAYYYPYLDARRTQVTTSNSFIIERSVRQGVLAFDRSISATYAYTRTPTTELAFSWSINDYILPSAALAYSIYDETFTSAAGNLIFQSPSRCWRLAISPKYDIAKKGFDWNFDLSLNLTGSGFGGVSQMANTALGR